MADLQRVGIFGEMNALDHGIGFVELPLARHADVDHGAVVAHTNDHRVTGRQLGLEPGN